jgi:UDP-2-acetamido-3-amino-2,3-dideoxy-glucuronate N-acetyltransferase
MLVQQIGPARLIRHFLFSLWQGVFDLLTFSPLRVLWLRAFGATIGRGTIIDKIDYINLDRTGLKGLTIGAHCFLGRGTLLDLAGSITLNDWVVVSPRVIVLSHMSVGFSAHPLYKKYPPKVSHTQLNYGVFVGSAAVILPGVTVGQKALVAAGSVVTQNVPVGKVVKGVPAK